MRGWFQRRRQKALQRANERRCALCRYAFVLLNGGLPYDLYNAHCRECPDNVLSPIIRSILELRIDRSLTEGNKEG